MKIAYSVTHQLEYNFQIIPNEILLIPKNSNCMRGTDSRSIDRGQGLVPTEVPSTF